MHFEIILFPYDFFKRWMDMLQNIYNGLDLSGFSHLQNFFLIIEFNFILLRFPEALFNLSRASTVNPPSDQS